MVGLEFYGFESELWYKTSDGRNGIFDENSTELIQPLLEKIRDCYPEAYKALSEYYEKSAANPLYYQYLMVRRFLNCNFSMLDPTNMDVVDVNIDGKFTFEKVPCPLRCECKLCGVVCMPKFNSTLSQQELRVGRLWYEGRSKAEIASELFISQETVNNHIRNIYSKLGVNKQTEFFAYAERNGLFK